MGRKSSIDRMPLEIKGHIQAMLATGSMTLDELVTNLKENFPAEFSAGELPSRSALHRYGAKLDRRLAAIRASTEAAKIIRAHAGDDQDARSEALTAMVQTELFDAILELQEAVEGDDENHPTNPAERVALLSKAAKNIATLTRSSVNLKEFQAKAEERARKRAFEDAAATAETTAKAQGLSKQGVAALREAIMGAL